MRDMPAHDHLELWRGIDDAVWREAARVPVSAATRQTTQLAASVRLPARATPTKAPRAARMPANAQSRAFETV